MELTIRGARGSFPAPGPDTTRYGGHTPCASIEAAPGELVVIDAGTGLKDLGDELESRLRAGGKTSAEAAAPILRVHLFLTHFHLDHVFGLPFFMPLYSPRCELVVRAAAPAEEIEGALASLMGGRLYPIPLRETASRKSFRAMDGDVRVGSLRISSCPLVHPQGSVAYKIERDGGPGAVVFATDTEHPESGVDERLAAFASGAAHLVCDATFTPEQYRMGRKGWGHSTYEAGARLAGAGRVERLLLGHLNPDFTDEVVDRLVESARRIFPTTSAAFQGLVLEI